MKKQGTLHKQIVFPQYYFVFQNKTYERERHGGYLWAPQATEEGRTNAAWTRMTHVRKGDVIFHSVKQSIVALSIAVSDCYPAIQPEAIQREKLWEDQGWRVDTQYIVVQNPVRTKPLGEQCYKLQPLKYGPFNRLGRGNTGYLFQGNRELAQFLFSEVLKINPDLCHYSDVLGFDTKE